MPPRLRPPLHDQVTAEAIMARMDGFEGYLDAIARDAREGRDASLTLTARLTAENTQEAIAKIWARIETSDAAHRQDLQNSYQRLTEAMVKRASDLELDREAWKKRVQDLEAWRNRLEGANGLVRWVSKYAPWLLTAAISGFALFGKKFIP